MLGDVVRLCPCGRRFSGLPAWPAGLLVVGGCGMSIPAFFAAGYPLNGAFVVLSLAALAFITLAGIGAIASHESRYALTLSSASGATVFPLLAFVALETWPSGDNGLGMIWLFFVAFPAIPLALTGLGLVLFVVRRYRHDN